MVPHLTSQRTTRHTHPSILLRNRTVSSAAPLPTPRLSTQGTPMSEQVKSAHLPSNTSHRKGAELGSAPTQMRDLMVTTQILSYDASAKWSARYLGRHIDPHITVIKIILLCVIMYRMSPTAILLLLYLYFRRFFFCCNG